jgi:thymidylate kinase
MTQRALLICFTGIDGSGKTTQAKLLVDWLVSKGVKSRYMWSRGEVLTIRKIFLFLGRKALGTSAREIANDQNSYSEYQNRKTRLMGNLLVRWLWSTMVRIEHIAQINRDIRPKIQDSYVIVCDRYLWDSSVDLAALNNKDPKWLLSGLNRLLWKFIPQPTITFFIDIPPGEALQRKNDIPSYEYVRKRTELYRYLAKRNSLTVINGCEDAAIIQDKIKNTIINYLEDKK